MRLALKIGIFSALTLRAASYTLAGFGPDLPARAELEAGIREGAAESRASAGVALAYLEEVQERADLARARFEEAAQIAPADFVPVAAQWIANRLLPASATPRPTRATEWLDVAIEGFRRVRLPIELASALRSRAALAPQGEKRLRILEEAMAAARLSGDPIAIAAIDGDWGEALRVSGDLSGAIEHLRGSVRTLEAAQAWDEAAKANASLARTYTLHGRTGEANNALIAARHNYEAANNPAGLMQLRIQQALLWSVAGERKKAIAELSAIRASVTSTAPAAVRIRMAGVAMAYLQLNEFKTAAEIAEEVIQAFPGRASVAAFRVSGVAAYFLGHYEDSVKRLASVEARAGGDAFNLREANRFRALALSKLGQTQEAAASMKEALRFDALLRERAVAEDEFLLAIDEMRAPLADHAIDLLWRAGLHREAFEAAEEFRARALMDQLSVHTMQGATLPETAALAARTKSNVIAYWVQDTGVYAWVIRPDGTLHAHRQQTNAIKPLVERARRLTTKPDLLAWQALHRILIQPLRGELDATAGLAIVPHGELLKLPFGALPDANGRYLAERFAIRTAPAADLLGVPARASEGSSVLLVGAPVHPAKDSLARELPPLPGAKQEIQTIRALAKDATVLTGSNALLAKLTGAIPTAAVVHFATHAIVDEADPRKSFLALSEGDKLTVNDVEHLELHAALVVLGACRSGSGRVSPEGLLGFPRAFLLAGAARVIAPLWDVPDEPTAILMAEFYRLYLRGGSPAEALRQAQMKLLTDLRAGRVSVETPAGRMVLPAHPILWAGFVVQGAE